MLSALIMLAFAIGAHGGVLAAEPARIVTSGEGKTKTVALTFDDGWHPERCKDIFDTLVRFDVPATWFPNAVYMGSAPRLWRSIAQRFPVANHTTHHVSLPGRSARQIRNEISSAERRIEKITGVPLIKLLRPPYGATNKKVQREAGRLGYKTIVLWDVSGNDTSPRATDRGVARAALRGKPGSIVLMHCGPDVTPRILPIVIARYACAGFRFATVEGLMAGEPGRKARAACPAPKLPAADRHAGAELLDDGSPEPYPAAAVTGHWRLTDALVGDALEPVPPDVVLTLYFEPKRVSGAVGCDIYVARSSSQPDGGLAFDRLMRSFNACDPPSDQAAIHLEVLVAGVGQRIVDESLELLDSRGQTVLRFAAVEPSGLSGAWVVSAVADDTGVLTDALRGAPVTVTFGPTGALSGSAGCATFRGGYGIRGEAITAGPLLTSSVTCDDDPDGTGERFLSALASVASWRRTDGLLELLDSGATVVMELVPSSGG